jgi:hypothetical protein
VKPVRYVKLLILLKCRELFCFSPVELNFWQIYLATISEPAGCGG